MASRPTVAMADTIVGGMSSGVMKEGSQEMYVYRMVGSAGLAFEALRTALSSRFDEGKSHYEFLRVDRSNCTRPVNTLKTI